MSPGSPKSRESRHMPYVVMGDAFAAKRLKCSCCLRITLAVEGMMLLAVLMSTRILHLDALSVII